MPTTQRRPDNQFRTLCMFHLPTLLLTNCRSQVPSIPQVHTAGPAPGNLLNALSNFAERCGKNISPTSDSATCNAPHSLTCLTDWIHSASKSTRGCSRASSAARTKPWGSCNVALTPQLRTGTTMLNRMNGVPCHLHRHVCSAALIIRPCTFSPDCLFKAHHPSRDVLSAPGRALVWMPWAVVPLWWPCTPGTQSSHRTCEFPHHIWCRLVSIWGPESSPTGGGKTCSGGTSGAGKRIRAAGYARRRSQESHLTASSNSMSHASTPSWLLGPVAPHLTSQWRNHSRQLHRRGF